jgi:hypothetical protein
MGNFEGCPRGNAANRERKNSRSNVTRSGINWVADCNYVFEIGHPEIIVHAAKFEKTKYRYVGQA